MSTVDVAALREAAEGAMAITSLAAVIGGQRWRLDGWPDELVEFVSTFDPPTILAPLDRLEAAEGAVERVRALIAERETEAAEASERLRERWANDPSHMKRDHQWRLGAVYGTADLRAALDGGR